MECVVPGIHGCLRIAIAGVGRVPDGERRAAPEGGKPHGVTW